MNRPHPLSLLSFGLTGSVDGPSRTIIVEPIVEPAPTPAPRVDPQPLHDPAREPERPREPAR